MFEALSTAEGWISLASLATLEIVLGIDNIVFISILTGRLPEDQQAKMRQLGLAFALIGRLGLLFAISWIMSLDAELFSVFGHGFSGRHLILLGGGLFLLFKSTMEIFEKMELRPGHKTPKASTASYAALFAQIMLLDLVFSLDSVITAVGMVESRMIMAIAMILAVGVMLMFANSIGNFINRHPSLKVLALSFLLLVGVLLLGEAFDQHINKGYVYFAMGFSLLVELINIRVRKTGPDPEPEPTE